MRGDYRLASVVIVLLASPWAFVVSAADEQDGPAKAVHPSAPATFPVGYHPARLGAELLAGESWQRLVAVGAPDNGWANLTKTGRFSIGSSAIPSNPSVLGI